MKTILIVEDSPTVRKNLETIIHDAGYDTVLKEDGQEGLEYITSHENNIDMIISDINMPNMDGLTMIKAVHDKGIKIPTILLTTESSADMVRDAKRFGAKGWLVKPFKPTQIIATIKKLTA